IYLQCLVLLNCCIFSSSSSQYFQGLKCFVGSISNALFSSILTTFQFTFLIAFHFAIFPPRSVLFEPADEVGFEQTTHVIFSEAVFPQEKEKNNEVVCVPLQMFIRRSSHKKNPLEKPLDSLNLQK